jgi:hypothetical protein
MIPSQTNTTAIAALSIFLQHHVMRFDLGWPTDLLQKNAISLREKLIQDKVKSIGGTKEQQEQERQTLTHLYENSIGYIDNGHLHYLQVRFKTMFGSRPLIPSTISVSHQSFDNPILSMY